MDVVNAVENLAKKKKNWLKLMNVNSCQHYFNINNRKYFFDGFDPETNTAYEFLGSYWHGDFRAFHPDHFNTCYNKNMSKLYTETFIRFNAIKKASINIIYCWEYDYDLNHYHFGKY